MPRARIAESDGGSAVRHRWQPRGFKLKDGSPAVGRASGTPNYVSDDFGGVARRTPASIGAYEGFPKTRFDLFGTGCPGTGGHVPVIGYTAR